MKSLEELREIFDGDTFATKTTGVELIDVGPKYAKCRLLLEDKHLNAMKNAMGGAIYTLADFTFAVASNAETMNTVTAGSSISFINPSKGNELISEAKCIKDGRSLAFYEVTITDNLDNIISVVTFTGAKVNR